MDGSLNGRPGWIQGSNLTPLSSPTKLAPHHNIFMTNLQKSPIAHGHGGNTSGSSTKVIESLHDQVDVLTHTNLQLTVQSHGLLKKLENTQDKESKLMEGLTKLKNENDTLNNVLQRETERLKELEVDLVKMNESCKKLNNENKKFKSDYNHINRNDLLLKDESSMIEAQYNCLVKSQDMFKRHYSSQILKLRNELNILTVQDNLGDFDYNTEKLTSKLDDFSDQFTTYQDLCTTNSISMNEAFKKVISDEIEIDKLDYSEQKQRLVDLTKEMDVDVNVEREINNAMDRQPRYIPKLRNISSSSNNSSKRTSFYGSLLSNKNEKSAVAPQTMGLPGVKRSASARKQKDLKALSDRSGSESPVGSRNTSTSSNHRK